MNSSPLQPSVSPGSSFCGPCDCEQDTWPLWTSAPSVKEVEVSFSQARRSAGMNTREASLSVEHLLTAHRTMRSSQLQGEGAGELCWGYVNRPLWPRIKAPVTALSHGHHIAISHDSNEGAKP